ncbi:MAG TPA: Clp protease N-terminal domain-containing protein, partial [Flavobacteriales bacterium]|nr:Clp protease N-terminal domain-containing protein [Flavobacteriales bacterium]
MDAKFSPRVREVITYSREEALRLGHNHIGIEHILLGLIREGDGNAIRILRQLDVDLDDLRRTIESGMEPASAIKPPDKDKIALVKQAEKMLKITFLEAKLFKSPFIETEHVLLSILKDMDNLATRTLNRFNVDYEQVKNELDAIMAGNQPNRPKPRPKAQGPSAEDDDDDSGSFAGGGGGPQKK